MARLRPSHPWNAGYSLPQNVMDEPYGEGVIITKQVARGTISALQPAYIVGGKGAGLGCADVHNGSLGSAGGKGSIGGSSLRGGNMGSLSGTVLDSSSLENGVEIGGGSDPIAVFGKNAARLIMAQIKTVPGAERVSTMRQVLNSLEGGLFDKVATATTNIQKRTGAAAPAAMETALAALLSQHYLDELKRLGKTGRPSGVLALAGSPDGLGGLLGDIWGGVSGAAKTIGKGVAGLSCRAAGSAGLSAAASISGGPAGAAGAQLASSLCNGNKSPAAADTYVPPQSTGPGMGTMLLVGGGLLAAVLLLRK